MRSIARLGPLWFPTDVPVAPAGHCDGSRSQPCEAEDAELMAIRKILLPFSRQHRGGHFSMAVIVARLWHAHLPSVAHGCKPRSGTHRARLVREADSRARSGSG